MNKWPIETWLGVLGFVLSSLQAVFGIIRARKTIKIKRAKIVPMIHKVDRPYIYVVLTTINTSSAPKPIYDIKLSLFDRFILRSIHEPCVILQISSKAKGSRTLCSTRLPVTLAPYSAEDIVVLFPMRSSKESERLHRTLQHNHRKPRSVPAHFHVATLPRSLDYEITADLANYTDEVQIVKRFRPT